MNITTKTADQIVQGDIIVGKFETPKFETVDSLQVIRVISIGKFKELHLAPANSDSWFGVRYRDTKKIQVIA